MMLSTRKIILHAIQIVLIALFLYTGVVKIMNFDEFGSQLRQSPILKPVAGWMVWLIPTTELLVVVFLVIPVRRLQGLYASSALLLVFSVYLVLLHYVSYYIPCDCGGFLEKLPPDLHILLNIVLAGLAMIGIRLEKRVRKPEVRSVSLT